MNFRVEYVGPQSGSETMLRREAAVRPLFRSRSGRASDELNKQDAGLFRKSTHHEVTGEVSYRSIVDGR